MRDGTPEARGQALVDAHPDAGNSYLLIYDPLSQLWNGAAVRAEFTLDDLAAVLVRGRETCAALTVAMELLDRLADDGPCEYDFYGCCQPHGLQQRRCPDLLARQAVAAWREVELERIEAAAALDDDLDDVKDHSE